MQQFIAIYTTQEKGQIYTDHRCPAGPHFCVLMSLSLPLPPFAEFWLYDEKKYRRVNTLQIYLHVSFPMSSSFKTWQHLGHLA